jgi:Predicted dehydrogenase
MDKSADVVVVGGGIVGLSTAYKISVQYPHLSVIVLEKENMAAAHQTRRNSGVIHSGIYYKPGSYKAIHCVKGRRELVAFAKEHRIPHDICGKIIVATENSELSHLEKVYNNGLANGVEDIEGYRARIRNHGHSCFLCEIVIRSQFHTTYEPEA